MAKRKKEASPFDQARHILKVVGKEIDKADEEKARGRVHGHINAAIVGTESLWQELRHIGQSL